MDVLKAPVEVINGVIGGKIPLPVEEFVEYKHLELSVQDKSMSPLDFWYANRYTFPKIYKVIKWLLSVLTTSCASGRCFSTLGHLINDRRSTIGSNIVDDPVSVKFNAEKIPDLKEYFK